MFRGHFTYPHSCVGRRLNINEVFVIVELCVCVCFSQTRCLLSCAFRRLAPQTLHIDQVLAGPKHKWSLLQFAKHKLANMLGHAFVLPSFSDLPPAAAQTRRILQMLQKWQKCWCKTAKPPAPPAHLLYAGWKIGPLSLCHFLLCLRTLTSVIMPPPFT